MNLIIASSLEKVLPKAIYSGAEKNVFTVFEGETLSFQAVFSGETQGIYKYGVSCDTDAEIKSYFVKNVAVDYATHEKAYGDSNYISHEPGLYPNLLVPSDRDWVYVNNIYHSVWFTVKAPCGENNITVSFTDEFGNTTSKQVKITVLSEKLPNQELIFTQWFHTDSVADFYGFDVFSEELWDMIEKYLVAARENGINMIFTPVFTPPLDVLQNCERRTVQLVKIFKDGNNYSFDFELLYRWIDMCKKIGFEYFEMPHLFTQWGAVSTAKFMVYENGEEKQMFGWHTPALSDEYNRFLSQFLSALIDALKQKDVFDKAYFHISDEPEKEHLEHYCNVKRSVMGFLNGCKIIDAVADKPCITEGGMDIPVIATDHIDDEVDLSDGEKWCYYCNGQCVDVSNRFVSMPSARNRSIGIHLYKYKITGFLNWGYCFYYSRFSKLLLNPYLESDAYGAFPAGDSFSVYPGADGPIPSIGLFVFNEALQDLRAFKLLEQRIGYESTVKFIEDFLGKTVTFKTCFSADEILKLREAVNKEILLHK